MKNALCIIGFFVIVIGAACMDSESLVFPMVTALAGCVLCLFGITAKTK